jgi:AcrR family transcriptional regulator
MDQYNTVMASAEQATGTRERLLAAAFRTLETEGAQGLQARKLTAAIGTSTMAVYTYFGGMPGLIDAMVRDGLMRFAEHVRARAPETDDPLADLFAGGLAYGEFALGNPQLYQLMFGLAGPPQIRSLPSAETAMSTAEGAEALSVLVDSVSRVLDAELIRPQEPRAAAAHILSVTHGFLMLQMGGFVEEELAAIMPEMAVNLMVGLGADRDRAERSLARAVAAGPRPEPDGGSTTRT